jgi:integrase
LAKARERRDEARRLLTDQIDPSARKKAQRLAQANTFEAIAREWLELQRRGLSEKTFPRKLGWLEDFLFPHLGRHPIAKITAPDLLAALKRIEARGFRETAHRAHSTASNVFRYAVATSRAERDISTDLRGALAPVITTNRAAITDAYSGEDDRRFRRVGAVIGFYSRRSRSVNIFALLSVFTSARLTSIL